MPHYTTARTLTIPLQDAHNILMQGLPTIKDVTITNGANPITIDRKRRLTANRYAMNGSITLENEELRIELDGMGNAHSKFANEIIGLLPAAAIDDHGVADVLAKMDRSAKFFAKLETGDLIGDLRKGERLRFMTSGVTDGHACAIMLTDRRVILKDTGLMSASMKEVDPSVVTSISTGRSMGGEQVHLTVSGERIDIETMPHGRGKEFAEKLRQLRDELSAPTPTVQATPQVGVDQLGKLAELHAAGVLTDDEFAAAKAKVLGI